MTKRASCFSAILAVPLLLFVSVTSTAPASDISLQSGTPRPEEVHLLDELAEWQWSPETSGTEGELASALASHSFGSVLASHEELVVSLPYGEEILATAERHQLDSLLVAAVVETESSFDADAISPQGALGLMQIMPGTAARYGIGNARDPRLNLEAGSRYLGSLLDRFDGDVSLALAAYNAGPSRVVRYGGVPPYPETTRYVERVLRRYLQHHRAAWNELLAVSGRLDRPAAD